MPNWVKNVATFEGNANDIAALLSAVRSEDSDFDFDKLLPMPKSLNVTDGSDMVRSIIYYLARLDKDEARETFSKIKDRAMFRDDPYVEKFLTLPHDKLIKESKSWDINLYDSDKKLGITNPFELGSTYVNNIIEYGAPTWYDWRCRFWGTKWNASDVVVEQESDEKVVITLETAWSHPLPVFVFLAMSFPDIKINLKYADEDLGSNCGIENFFDRKMKVYEFENFEESLRFACDLWGYSSEETEEIMNDNSFEYDGSDISYDNLKSAEYCLISDGSDEVTQTE